MRRTLLTLVALFTALAFLPLSGSASAAPGTLDRDAATQLLAMVNAERAANGLAILVDDPALRGYA